MYFPLPEKSALNFIGNKKQEEKQNKITFSTYCAAALIELLKRQRDAIGLTVFSENIESHTQAKSSSLHNKLLFHQLEKLIQPKEADVHKKTFAIEALHQIAEIIHKRSLVFIFSDMMDTKSNGEELFSALQHLKHNKHEVILFHVIDKQKEVDFNFDNRPYRFIDLETEEELKLHPNEIKEHYLKSMQEFKKQLLLKCSQYKIDFVEADINLGFEQVLMPYLIKRTKMV